jgi:hypothetical protein
MVPYSALLMVMKPMWTAAVLIVASARGALLVSGAWRLRTVRMDCSVAPFRVPASVSAPQAFPLSRPPSSHFRSLCHNRYPFLMLLMSIFMLCFASPAPLDSPDSFAFLSLSLELTGLLPKAAMAQSSARSAFVTSVRDHVRQRYPLLEVGPVVVVAVRNTAAGGSRRLQVAGRVPWPSTTFCVCFCASGLLVLHVAPPLVLSSPSTCVRVCSCLTSVA